MHWESKIESRYKQTEGVRICQGDILKDITFLTSSGENFEEPTVLKYAVVMSQDCDLDRDFIERSEEGKDSDKHLSTILVCPAFPSELFCKGEHIGDWKMKTFNKSDLETLQKNEKLNRYHFLVEEEGVSIPNLVIDFKRFYTVPRELLYQDFSSFYLTTVNELFRERLSQRFANYLSRFGLPESEE